MSADKIIKPQLFALGGCDLWDAIDSSILRKHFNIDRYTFPKSTIANGISPATCRPTFSATSLRSLYSPPGDIALRLHESVQGIKNLDIHHQGIYEEILKYPYLEFYRKHAGPADILLLSFSPELYTKFSKKTECFTMIPLMKRLENPADPMHWLYKEFLSNELYHVAFDESENLNVTYDIMKDFARDIRSIFGNRIIVVKTHLSDKVMSSSLGKIVQHRISCEQDIPFYKVSKIMHTPTDHSYAKRMTDLIIQRFLRIYKDELPVIELDESDIFIDAEHRYGVAPFHLHKTSTSKIGEKILLEILKLTANKNNANVRSNNRD